MSRLHCTLAFVWINHPLGLIQLQLCLCSHSPRYIWWRMWAWRWTETQITNARLLVSSVSHFQEAALSPTTMEEIISCLTEVTVRQQQFTERLAARQEYTDRVVEQLQASAAGASELLVFPANPTLQHDFTIQLGSSTITTSASVRNLGVIFDNQLTFKEHIAKTARSCRFALHNIRKIRPFLTEHAAQLFVQALVISRLDYCNALLAGLPSNTIKPLQMIQNAVA